MAEEPQIGWAVDEFQTELAAALDWLREQGNAPWQEVQAGFLQQLDVTDSQLQTVRYGVYLLLVTYFAEELTGVQRMAFLFEQSQQRQKLAEFVEEWCNGLSWVTGDQRAQLDELWEVRGDWREWLPGQLSEWWPEWVDSTPDVLAPWLDGYLPGLVLPAGLAGEEPVTEPSTQPVTGLGWVTPAQQEQLAASPRDGDWREWLPGELDRRIPGWTELGPDELTGRLDSIIAFLELPYDPVVMDISENVVKPAMDELREKVPEMAETLHMDPGALSAYIDSMPDDFFADKLYEATLELQ